MNEQLLTPYIRAVTEEDKENLETFSYSKLEQFLNCPMAYQFKYQDEHYSTDTSLALELGSLFHLVLENKGLMLTQSTVDYEKLYDIEHRGFGEVTEKTKNNLLGLDALKAKYWETWSVPDSEGHTYDWKVERFHDVLQEEMEQNDGWEPISFEKPFEFVWDNRAIIHGFIDRIDCKNGIVYRTIDYKTSKKPYDATKLATSLQFGIYALAILNEFGRLPIESVYRFICIDDSQLALTKGWEKRLIKKLTNVFDKIDTNKKSGFWNPNPTPLCYYCNFCSNNPNAHEFKTLCDYYSKWTPSNKTFETNKPWEPEKKVVDKRKIIF